MLVWIRFGLMRIEACFGQSAGFVLTFTFKYFVRKRILTYLVLRLYFFSIKLAIEMMPWKNERAGYRRSQFREHRVRWCKVWHLRLEIKMYWFEYKICPLDSPDVIQVPNGDCLRCREVVLMRRVQAAVCRLPRTFWTRLSPYQVHIHVSLRLHRRVSSSSKEVEWFPTIWTILEALPSISRILRRR